MSTMSDVHQFRFVPIVASMPYHNIYIPRVRTPSFLISSEIPAQMTVLQQAQLYVDQLRREASKQRINVSEAITDMKVML